MSRVAYVDGQDLPHGSATVHIIGIDGAPVGDGMPGPFTRRLRERYLAHVAEAA